MRIVATAGHVDHGKSTLVRHLTGTDPDRLPEERRRGLTIDLGFAHATLPSGREAGFVDVPGHARFVGNMLAGVGAADACLFVVAATEGWRPQSEEHLRILELLGVRHGLVALTKVGLVDDEWRALAELEVADHVRGTFLQHAPVVPVDVPAGIGTDGSDGLAATLDRVLAATAGAADHDRPRLWIDRAFAVRGAGTVVTGSLLGGAVAVGDHLRLEPRGTDVRVRGLQSHGRALDHAGPGRRLAVNLLGVSHHDVGRGDVLVAPGRWHRCTVLDASVHVLAGAERAVERRGAWLATFGSGEHAVRLRPVGRSPSIEPGGSGPVRMWLPVPLPLLPGDRYVLRDAGRQLTVGGGEVLDVAPRRPASRATPTRSVDRVVAERGWVTTDELQRLTGERRAPTLGPWVVDPAALLAATDDVRRALQQAGPAGLDVATLDERARAVLTTLADVVLDGPRAHLAGTGAPRPADLAAHPYLAALRAQPFAPPAPEATDPAELRALERHGLVVERDGVWFSAEAVAAAATTVARLLAEAPDGVPVSALRQALGTSRKYALPLVAHLDATGVTRRRGDLRVAGPRLPAVGGTGTGGGRAATALDRIATEAAGGAGDPDGRPGTGSWTREPA